MLGDGVSELRGSTVVIGVFTSCGQALHAVEELAVHGVADEQLSVLVCRGVSRLTAPELSDSLAGEAAGRLAGAVLAALFAASKLCFTDVDVLGAGPLMRAIGRVEDHALVGASLAERLILLGFDVATAESVDAGFCSGDIVLGVDSNDEQLCGAAMRAFARAGGRSGVAAPSAFG